ncbi:type I-E CRISPR-associated endonuclease Cas1e [Phytomonospora endophytica]|uniref:CRISPR-associated endonuclease Cas1 n=1 Tax=Phytomonospora endophytica TaxID=714109 RepID=A0A841FQM2_9ACTN|nr:type I-E CRISPR-associated endonuclease Cas1e [Phytomonospora endophytica]MBB6039591.1 CRISPR-associated protein Cas1 [Phytomonospora endophytica]GIG70556.1 CRISPR-associated endonuclease Cas1 2 [Phytomonospora endophytica]
MATTDPRRRLAAPTVAMLPRIADSLSFLYLEHVRVVQDDTGVCAQVVQADGRQDKVYLPVAALACILLGTGTSATSPAIATIARHGATVLWTGSGGVRMYAAGHTSEQGTHWLERQVRAWADTDTRLETARLMYEMRFDEDIAPGTGLNQLRGLEGQRMKRLYQALADKYRLRGFRRQYDPHTWDAQNPVNQALSAANTALYGIVHAAICALGCSPALGFVHSGKQLSFVYDIADLYKAEHTVPLAFALHRAGNPDSEARRRLRDEFRLYRLMPRIVNDIQALLDPDTDTDTDTPDEIPQPQVVNLWDPIRGELPGGVNYATNEDW